MPWSAKLAELRASKPKLSEAAYFHQLEVLLVQLAWLSSLK